MLRDWIVGDTFVWLVSDEILLEYKRVLGRLGVRRALIGKIVNLLREQAELVPASFLPNISPDPGDDPFCGCAEAGRADFIVTLNPKDFPQSLLSAHVIKPASAFQLQPAKTFDAVGEEATRGGRRRHCVVGNGVHRFGADSVRVADDQARKRRKERIREVFLVALGELKIFKSDTFAYTLSHSTGLG